MSDAPPAPPPAAVPATASKLRLRAFLAVAEPLSIAGWFIFLLATTWLRWCNPLVDFPRDLYLAWRISAGDVLYAQLGHWYGPLAPLVEGAGDKIFGVGLDTIVWMNIAVTAAVLLLLRGISWRLGNRLTVWLSSVAFLSVFAFGHYGLWGNYNFITPYTATATYCFLGLVLMLWGLLKHLDTRRPLWLGLAGLGLAIVYLDKVEGVLAAGGALGVYLLVQSIRVARQDGAEADWRAAGHWLIHALGWLVGGFLVLWLPVFGYFLFHGGWLFALSATNFTVVSLLNPAVRAGVAQSPWMRAVEGIDEPWVNFLAELWQGFLFASLCAGMVWAAKRWRDFPSGGLRGWLLPLVALGAAAGAVWPMCQYVSAGTALTFPVGVSAFIFVLWSIRRAWQRGTDVSRWLRLALVGVAASLMLARMILTTRIMHYGFFMTPLAVFFGIHVLEGTAVEARLGLGRHWLRPALVAGLVLVGTVSLLSVSLTYYRRETYAVGSGRDRFYFYPPEVFDSGECLNTMIAAFQEKTPHAQTLAAFPEGIAANYHLRVRSPLRELEFNPIILQFAGPQNVVAQLQAHPPDAVLLYHRNYADYGTPNFGVTEATGRGIAQWLVNHDTVVYAIGRTPDSLTGYAIILMVPNDAAQPPPAVPTQPGP